VNKPTMRAQYNFERACYARHCLQNKGIVTLWLLGGCEHQRGVTWIWFDFPRWKILVRHPNRNNETVLPYGDTDYIFLIEGETQFRRKVWDFFFCLRYLVLLVGRRIRKLHRRSK